MVPSMATTLGSMHVETSADQRVSGQPTGKRREATMPQHHTVETRASAHARHSPPGASFMVHGQGPPVIRLRPLTTLGAGRKAAEEGRWAQGLRSRVEHGVGRN